MTGLARLLVADVLSRWPQTAPVFLRRRLACVGCSLARFERIADVAASYSLDLAALTQDLQQAIEAGGEDAKSAFTAGKAAAHTGATE